MKVLLKKNPLKPYIPEWIDGFLDPALQDLGPRVVSYSDLRTYTWPKNFSDDIPTRLAHLRKIGAIFVSPGLDDAVQLIQTGDVPDRISGHICIWRSICYDPAGNLFLPVIQKISGQRPIVYWWWLKYKYKPIFTTVLFGEHSDSYIT